METKLVRVSKITHQRLCDRGNKSDTFDSIIENLLDLADDYEDVKELIEADNEIKNGEYVEFDSMEKLFDNIESEQ